MAIVNSPPTYAVDQQNERGVLIAPAEGWRNFFVAVYNICNALTMSGTTAQRPTSLLWTGRFFWDTTLGIPIWYNGIVWVNAAGAPV